jgi:hypothetical protein
MWIPAALVLAACLGLAIFWGVHAHSLRLYDLFWMELLDRGRSSYVVTGDSGLAMLQDLTGTEVHLNDYISGNLESKFPSLLLKAPGREAGYGAERFSNYTSTADLSIALGIAGRALQYGRQAKVLYARDMHMEDLKNANAILLGGPHANPWAELFEPQSNFRMEFPMQLEGMHIDGRRFVNKHPRVGEQSTYANLAGSSSHVTYALVSFLAGADGAGHVLLLQGENMAGTQAAGDFVLDPRTMESILQKARLSDGSIGPFEVLLEARTVGANAPKARISVERFGTAKPVE